MPDILLPILPTVVPSLRNCAMLPSEVSRLSTATSPPLLVEASSPLSSIIWPVVAVDTEVLPTNTLPELSMRIRSALLVVKSNGRFSRISILPEPLSRDIWKPSPEASPVDVFFRARRAWPEPPFIATVLPLAPLGELVPMPTLPELSMTSAFAWFPPSFCNVLNSKPPLVVASPLDQNLVVLET